MNIADKINNRRKGGERNVEKAIYDEVGLKAGMQEGCFIFDMNGMLVGDLSDCNREDDTAERETVSNE